MLAVIMTVTAAGPLTADAMVFVQVHVPIRKFIEAKSGYDTGTGVGAAYNVVCAVETSGAMESVKAKSAHPNAAKAEVFMPLVLSLGTHPAKRVSRLLLL